MNKAVLLILTYIIYLINIVFVFQFQYHFGKTFSTCSISSKKNFTPKCGGFCKADILRYLDLCNVNPAYHKVKTFPLL